MRIPDEQGHLGRYDDLCESFCELTKAKLVALIVLDGDRGTGFSVSSPSMDHIQRLPTILRTVADGIDARNKAAKTN